jgi:hypothetical protein
LYVKEEDESEENRVLDEEKETSCGDVRANDEGVDRRGVLTDNFSRRIYEA